MTQPWLPITAPSGTGGTRLFCFPYAGGGAQAYRLWQKTLGDRFEVYAVQPPGRWGRLSEPPLSNMSALVEAAVQGLRSFLTDDFALFGHSVGAIVAFELARSLRRKGLPQPRHLFVAAHRAPQITWVGPSFENLTDKELIEFVSEQYQAIPEAILNEPELLKLTLPALRMDLKMDQNYRCSEEDPLDCPITVFGGAEDKATTRPWLEAWRNHTNSDLDIELFPGGHFFVNDARALVLGAVARSLDQKMCQPMSQ